MINQSHFWHQCNGDYTWVPAEVVFTGQHSAIFTNGYDNLQVFTLVRSPLGRSCLECRCLCPTVRYRGEYRTFWNGVERSCGWSGHLPLKKKQHSFTSFKFCTLWRMLRWGGALDCVYFPLFITNCPLVFNVFFNKYRDTTARQFCPSQWDVWNLCFSPQWVSKLRSRGIWHSAVW